MRPGLFWIDEIWRQGRDSSPIVNAGVEQIIIIWRGKIGWRLNVDLWHEQTCDRDGTHHFALRGFGPVVHRDLGLGAKVLNDDFLNVSVAAMQVADGNERVHAIVEGFADANEQARGEGNILLARLLNGAQAFGRYLVGSIVMGCTGGKKRGTGSFKHQAHAGRN